MTLDNRGIDTAILEKLKTFSIYFATAAYESKVDTHYLDSMLRTQDILNKMGINNGLSILDGDCYIQRARNEFVGEFRKSDASHLFFIDNDIGWDASKVVKVLTMDKDVVVGAYCTKREDSKYVIDPLPGEVFDGKQPFRLRGAATGFMCIKRHVIETMWDAYSTYRYESDEGKILTALFHCDLRKLQGDRMQRFYGEDIDFCHKWLNIRGEIWCDPDIDFTHAGYKVWKCNYTKDFKNDGQQILAVKQ